MALTIQSHLNALVRKCTSQHLAAVVEKIGAERLLSGTKDITERILPAVSRLTQDSFQETRLGLVLPSIQITEGCYLPLTVTDHGYSVLLNVTIIALRYFGRRMLLLLSSHPDFDKVVAKYIPDKDLATIKDTLLTLKTKVAVRHVK